MLAPRRRPPCLITSVAVSNTRMNEMGPEAMPWVERTMSPLGRTRENEKPVPPPDWWISAMLRTAPKMLAMSSSMGMTKQAESWPMAVPAFINVGELGRNSRLAMALKKRSSASPTSRWNRDSTDATAPATRRNIWRGVSMRRPSSSLRR